MHLTLALLSLLATSRPSGSAGDEPDSDVSADPAERPASAVPGGRPLRLRAARVDDDVMRIDGRIRPEEWAGVPAMPALIQTAPRYGAPAAHPTEARVAYGKDGVYVAFILENASGDGAEVRGAFARKDQVPSSDKVSLMIDPSGDGVTGYFFEVNASGAQADAYIYRDDRFDFLWDGVWSSAARRTEHGWTAEMYIPWSTMRFEVRPTYTFGVNVSRFVNADAESQHLSPAPQGVPGLLSYAAHYEGVRGIRPRLNLELRPFVSGRFSIRRPSGSLDRSWRALPNAGIVAKYAITGNLTLDVAVNPDFGQAEVDPAVLNLGPFEVFFPERRQFFLESKEIFETRFNLFYSRRIGNNPSATRADTTQRRIGGQVERGRVTVLDPQTRILEAVRVTGEAAPGWRVGAITATTGPTFGMERFSRGPGQPIRVDPTTQWSVARVRREYDGQTYIGGMATAVNRAGGEPDAFTGGVDYAIRFRDRWNHEAQVIGTHDGEDPGMGVSTQLGRRSEHWAFDLSGRLLTPDANFNDMGFMQFANVIEGDSSVEAFTARPLGKFRSVSAETSIGVGTTFDEIMYRKFMMNRVGFLTEGLWRFELFGGGQLSRLDPYETRGGIPYRVPFHWWTGGTFETPFNRRIVGRMNWAYGEQAGKPGPDLGVDITLRPFARLEANLGVQINASFGRPRWVTDSDMGEPVFGRADVISTNGTLRFTLGITPQLTLQSFNQLLHTTAHHEEFFVLENPDTLVPTGRAPYLGVVDQALTSLISNSVLRWEYLPGSFLYVVYTHRTSFNGSGMLVRYQADDAFTNLVADGAASEDILFVKLVHLFAL